MEPHSECEGAFCDEGDDMSRAHRGQYDPAFGFFPDRAADLDVLGCKGDEEGKGVSSVRDYTDGGRDH